MAEPMEKLRLNQFIRALPPRRYRVEIVEFNAGRSNPQNAYYHAVVIPVVVEYLAEQWGESVGPDDAHSAMRDLFLPAEHTNQSTGEVICLARSTTTLDTTEFSDYLDNIIKLLGESGFEVPQPRWYRNTLKCETG